ncbi:Executer 2 protein [Thalictrum thalictroides]|uniref:Executer 2 protein n=1 Tax=Thalictrum thalictroides TaxID=46969 RepID=A0A7J6XBA6_THATH|nr:Executer 2 protein [Thalictrum thalictroides]
MAIANAWSMPGVNPSTHHLKQSYFEPFGKKQSNLSFIGSIANKPNSRNFNLPCRCSISNSSDWDWNRWTRHFSDIEQAESVASVLKFQLEEAVEKEDFHEAAKLKKAIAEATSKDAVAEIMFQLKNAIDEERYHDASRLCKLTGSGLVGWWVGCSKDCNDPFGRVIQITPGVGRFTARSYTPRQLVAASSGTPLFEIYVYKEDGQTYTMQAVFLQQAKKSSTDFTLSPSPSKPTDSPLIPSSGNASIRSIPDSEESIPEGSGVTNLNTTDANNIGDSSEGLKSVLNYLKEKIPGAKFKVKANILKEMINDSSESMEQVVQDDEETTSVPRDSEDGDHSQNDIQGDETQLAGGTEEIEKGKHVATKLIIGGILHNKEDALSKDDYVRSPAEIKDMERDSFTLHVCGRNKDTDFGDTQVSKDKEEFVAAQVVSELMPVEVAKAFLGVDKNPSKASKDIHEIFKLAVSKRSGLSRITSFTRISTSKDDLDPFDGLYVGAFGPLGAEVVQLRRKFGHWHGETNSTDVEFFEYVEAVKLTGDLNVPAGQVTFRAKIGKGNRSPNRGKYPDDLGVVSSYKGQGRTADVGFRNPRWVEGELLQLSGKGMWPYIGGADLGFLYAVPEKSFLVLLNRLKLPE